MILLSSRLCFQTVSEKLQKVLILEDNVDFELTFHKDRPRARAGGSSQTSTTVGPHVSLVDNEWPKPSLLMVWSALSMQT